MEQTLIFAYLTGVSEGVVNHSNRWKPDYAMVCGSKHFKQNPKNNRESVK